MVILELIHAKRPDTFRIGLYLLDTKPIAGLASACDDSK